MFIAHCFVGQLGFANKLSKRRNLIDGSLGAWDLIWGIEGEE